MIEYKFGSTFNVWNTASTVTGSVAERTDPNIIESSKDSESESIPIRDNIQTRILKKIIEINITSYEVKNI